MEGIRIQQIYPANLDINKGATYEWCKGQETRQLTLCYRKAGVISGNHFHTGKDVSKNPERVLLISGKINLITYDGEETIEQIVEKEASEITIEPNILHSYISLNDSIFIEQRLSIFDPEDTDAFPADRFQPHLQGLNQKVNLEALQTYLKLMDHYNNT